MALTVGGTIPSQFHNGIGPQGTSGTVLLREIDGQRTAGAL